jgi:hypothetical protein
MDCASSTGGRTVNGQQREYMETQLKVRMARLADNSPYEVMLDDNGHVVYPPHIANDRRDIETMREKLA